MKASDQVKAAGLHSLKELETLSGRSRFTLMGWAKVKPELFTAAINNAVIKKEKNKALKN